MEVVSIVADNQTALSEIINLRASIGKLQKQIDGLMPDAIAEALQVQESQPKGQIVYQNSDGKIVLVLRKKFSTPEEDTKLSRLDADIKSATTKLAQKHANELEEIALAIEQLKEAIADLEAKRDKLLSSRYISRLKNAYKIRRENSSYFQPNLSVFLK